MTTNSGALPGWFKRRPPATNANDPGDPPADPTTGSTTLRGGDDGQTPVVVWEAANRMEAEIVAGRLHAEGIPAIIRGEALGTIYGLTTGSLAAANVLVPAPLAEQALALLATEVEWEDAEQPFETREEDTTHAGTSGLISQPDESIRDGDSPTDHRA